MNLDRIVELASKIKYHKDEAARLEEELRAFVSKNAAPSKTVTPKIRKGKKGKPAVNPEVVEEVRAAFIKEPDDIWSVNEIRDKVKRNYVTVSSAIEVLAKEGVIEQLPFNKSGRTIQGWCYKRAR